MPLKRKPKREQPRVSFVATLLIGGAPGRNQAVLRGVKNDRGSKSIGALG